MKTTRSSLFIPAVFAGSVLCVSANAATPNVNAGSLLRQNEHELKTQNQIKKINPCLLRLKRKYQVMSKPCLCKSSNIKL
jgi:hypothetical protein